MLLSGCALNEIARKEDIAVAKTDLWDELQKLRHENRALSEKLEAAGLQIDQLKEQIKSVKAQTVDSVKFMQEKLNELSGALDAAKKDQEKISTDFTSKIGVVLEEVSKENSRLNERIDKFGEKSKHARHAAAVPQTDATAYVVSPGDTLAKISKRTGVSISTLLKLNAMENPNDLQAGQKLTLPSRETVPN